MEQKREIALFRAAEITWLGHHGLDARSPDTKPSHMVCGLAEPRVEPHGR
jgi:hypothetical protein